MSTRKFDTLTPRGKAVRIAKDVLAQLAAKKFIARNMVYFRSSGYVNEYGSLNNYLSSGGSCEVCALGSAVCSLANLNGPVTVWEAKTGGKKQLEPILGRDQLSLIESAFEVSEMGDPSSLVEQTKAVAFGRKYKNPTNRLKAIMNNIIQNRGVFRP